MTFPHSVFVKHKTFGKVKVSSSRMQGAKTALRRIDIFVSAALCSVNMGCFVSSACELWSPGTAHPYGHFTVLCCKPFIRPTCLTSHEYCNCSGSAANRFDCTQLQRKDLDFHCLELGWISRGDFVYTFMLLC